MNCSGVVSVYKQLAACILIDAMKFSRHSARLFDPRDDSGPIKQSMAQEIAGGGLSYSHLKELYLKLGTKGLLTILSMPPSQSTATKPRVARTKRILDVIANHLKETFPKKD